MKRYNGKNGYPEMEENPHGHWVTYYDFQLELLNHNKSADRNWESSCCTRDKFIAEYEDLLSKQQNIIVGLSAVLFLIVGILILNWI